MTTCDNSIVTITSNKDGGGVFTSPYNMNTLFPIEPAYPPGFSYTLDFITVEEETSLLKVIEAINLHTFLFKGYEAQRKVASFGYDYSFEKRQLSRGKEIPDEFDWLTERVAKYLSLPRESIAELLVTQYPVGSVINWHRDAPPFDVIIGISLNTDCTFKLRPHEKAKQNRKATVSLPVQRRSLYVMRGEARDGWEHSTAPVGDLRCSITLRTLKR